MIIQQMFIIKIFIFLVDIVGKLVLLHRCYRNSTFKQMNVKKSNQLDFNQKEDVLISQ